MPARTRLSPTSMRFSAGWLTSSPCRPAPRCLCGASARSCAYDRPRTLRPAASRPTCEHPQAVVPGARPVVPNGGQRHLGLECCRVRAVGSSAHACSSSRRRYPRLQKQGPPQRAVQFRCSSSVNELVVDGSVHRIGVVLADGLDADSLLCAHGFERFAFHPCVRHMLSYAVGQQRSRHNIEPTSDAPVG